MFLLDKEKELFNIEWEHKYGVSWNLDVIQDLDELGCLRTINKYLPEALRETVLRNIDNEKKEIIDDLFLKLKSCNNLIEAYGVISPVKKYLQEIS